MGHRARPKALRQAAWMPWSFWADALSWPALRRAWRTKTNNSKANPLAKVASTAISAFLGLDLPGEKWVAGDGPEAPRLRKQYPGVRFLGMLSPHALADTYRQADVFVFPSRTDTFGLVMIEAMACGLPVAAFPVAGPLDVIGQSQAGVLDENLREAAMACVDLPADKPISRAASFTWARATDQFLGALVPMRALSES
jgi:glycosyltransferase involved in cell wall biosynthesis